MVHFARILNRNQGQLAQRGRPSVPKKRPVVGQVVQRHAVAVAHGACDAHRKLQAVVRHAKGGVVAARATLRGVPRQHRVVKQPSSKENPLDGQGIVFRNGRRRKALGHAQGKGRGGRRIFSAARHQNGHAQQDQVPHFLFSRATHEKDCRMFSEIMWATPPSKLLWEKAPSSAGRTSFTP
jgi:hypothetical protein